METQDLTETARLLQKNWGVDVANADSWERLREALFWQLREWLQKDFERLVQTMYRLDVSESRFHIAMQGPDVNVQARALADLVLERELQRLATWKKYSH